VSAWVYLPLALSLVLSVLSQPLARRLSPRTATPALVLTTMLVAAATTWGLVLLAATLLHEAPPVAEHAVRGPSAVEPVPAIIAATALVLLTVGLYRMVATLNRQLRAHRVLRGLCGHLGVGELVVLADDQPHAVAVPGRRGVAGRILVSSGMLAVLTDEERAVLLAHERTHLREHHHWQQAVADCAAALNPLLSPVRNTVAFLLERSADEAAATAVGSRPLAARSLAKAALASTAGTRGETLAFHRLAVTTRVAALQAAPPPPRPLVALATIALGVLTTLAAADATLSFVEFVERLLPGGV